MASPVTSTNSHARSEAHAALVASLHASAAAHAPAALLLLEVQIAPNSDPRTHAAEEQTERLITAAAERCAAAFPGSTWARTSWRGHEFLLEGTADELCRRSVALLDALLATASEPPLAWRLILTSVFPGDALRTLHCDPAYDLPPSGSFVAWVAPYAADDWREPHRYPTTTVVCKRE
jgi:hypothetical protein